MEKVLDVVYLDTLHQDPIFATSSGYFVFFLVSGPIFMWLFGGLFELHFLQTVYAWKYLDV